MGMASKRNSLSGSNRFSFRRNKKPDDEGFLSYLDPSKLNMSLTAITEEDVEKWMYDMGLLYMDDDDDDESIASYSTDDIDTVGTGSLAERGSHSCMPGRHPLFYIPVLTWDFDQACHQISSMPKSITAGGSYSSQCDSGIASFEELEIRLTEFWQSFPTMEALSDDTGNEDGKTPKRPRSVRFADELTTVSVEKPSESPWKRLRQSGSKTLFTGPKGKRWKMVAFRRPGKKRNGKDASGEDKLTDVATMSDEKPYPTSVLKHGNNNDVATEENSYFFSLIPEDALESINQLLFPTLLENEDEDNPEEEGENNKEKLREGTDITGRVERHTQHNEAWCSGIVESVPFDESVNGDENLVEQFNGMEQLGKPASPRSVIFGSQESVVASSQVESPTTNSSSSKDKRRLLKSLSSLGKVNEVDESHPEAALGASASDKPLERTLENSPSPGKCRLEKVRKATASISDIAISSITSALASTRSIASSPSIGKTVTEDSFDAKVPQVSASPSSNDVEVASLCGTKVSSKKKAYLRLPSLKATNFKRLSLSKSKVQQELPEAFQRGIPVRITIIDQQNDDDCAQMSSPSSVSSLVVLKMLEAEDKLYETLQQHAEKRDTTMMDEIHPWRTKVSPDELPDGQDIAANLQEKVSEESQRTHKDQELLTGSSDNASKIKKPRAKKKGEKPQIPIEFIEFPSNFDPALDDRFGDNIDDPLIIYIKKATEEVGEIPEHYDNIEFPLDDYMKKKAEDLEEDNSVHAILPDISIFLNPRKLILESTTDDDRVLEEEQPWGTGLEQDYGHSPAMNYFGMEKTKKLSSNRLSKVWGKSHKLNAERGRTSISVKRRLLSSFKGHALMPPFASRDDSEQVATSWQSKKRGNEVRLSMS
jgi:hypothetical protein